MVSTLISVLAGVALLIFISLRQLRWQPVDLRRLITMPVILLGAGVVIGAQTYQSLSALHPGAGDVMSIVVELVLAVVGGLLMGRLTKIETIDGQVRSRLTGPGLAIWCGFIAVRIGMAVLAHATGAELASSTPLIFLMIAVVKATQAFVISQRVSRHRAIGTGTGRPESARTGVADRA